MSETRTALVTGAGARIGRALAVGLAQAGWQVAIHYHASADQAEETADQCRAFGVTATTVSADLADEEQVQALMPQVTEVLGPVSCLINNASLFDYDDFDSTTQDSWQAHMAVNLRAPFVLSQAMVAQLPEDAAGNIINIIDQRVWKLTPDFTSYTLSKAGLWTLTQTMAQALAPRVRVNAIAPGPTLQGSRQSDEHFARQVDATLLRRQPGLEEFTGAVNFILESPSLTGQMMALDSGQHLAWETPDVVDVDR